MRKISPVVITISCQLGSGGAFVGQQVTKNLNIKCRTHFEILRRI